MTAWDDETVIANSKNFTAGESASALADGYHTPAVCVSLESLDGNADDTITVAFTGAAGDYDIDSRTLSEPGSYVVDAPQCESVSVTSTNGAVITAEVRNNPR